jgi:hypothetical protein
VLAVGLAAGCGGKANRPGIATANGGANSPGASPSASLDPEEQQRRFTQCMRDHGVDMPDPDSDGRVRITASGGPDDKTEQAVQACQQYLPAGKLATPDAATMEAFRQYAQCMREHGVDIPDPDAGGGGGFSVKKGGPSGGTTGGGGFSQDDPAFKAADEACKDKLPGKRVTQDGGGPK